MLAQCDGAAAVVSELHKHAGSYAGPQWHVLRLELSTVVLRACSQLLTGLAM